MAGLGSSTTVEAGLGSISPIGEKSAEQAMGSAGNISLEKRVNAAFQGESDEYQQFFQAQYQTQQKTSQTKQEGATNLLSIGNAVYEAFYGNINDIRAWNLLYGPIPALVLTIFGRKSVWKMQAELLGRPGWPDPGDSGDPDDPDGPDDAWGRFRPHDRAAEEYKRTIEAESGRIGVAVCISTGEPKSGD